MQRSAQSRKKVGRQEVSWPVALQRCPLLRLRFAPRELLATLIAPGTVFSITSDLEQYNALGSLARASGCSRRNSKIFSLITLVMRPVALSSTGSNPVKKGVKVQRECEGCVPTCSQRTNVQLGMHAYAVVQSNACMRMYARTRMRALCVCVCVVSLYLSGCVRADVQACKHKGVRVCAIALHALLWLRQEAALPYLGQLVHARAGALLVLASRRPRAGHVVDNNVALVVEDAIPEDEKLVVGRSLRPKTV
eukprot:2915336-Pleurochrysis_carterae.AAC.2